MEATLGSSAMADLGERILGADSQNQPAGHGEDSSGPLWPQRRKDWNLSQFPSPNLLIKLTYPGHP